MAAFLTAAFAALGESSIGGAIVRILIAYGISRLINGSQNSNSPTTPIDKGVRLQLSPDTTNPIPLVYGSTYLGAKITDGQITDANQTMWYCLTICESGAGNRLSDNHGVVHTIDEIYMNNNRVVLQSDGVTVDYVYTQDPSGTKSVDKNPQGLVKIYFFDGGSGSNILPTDAPTGATVPTTDARSLMPGWTNDHRMTNLTFALVKLTYNSAKGITSLPTFQFKVSNNLYQPGDAIYDYLTRSISGAGLSADQIDTDSLRALNTYSNELVTYVDPVTFQQDTLIRYMINGLIDPSKKVFDNLQQLANASGSFINYDITRGKWSMKINRDYSPGLAFNDSNMLGGISVTGTSLDSMYNAVEVSFPHRELQSQMDTVRIDIPRDGNTFLNPNEPENILKISYDLVDEPLQALELGYIELYQNRMDQVITFTTDYSMFQVEAGDIITVTQAIYSWDHKPFRVIRVREIESDQGGLALEITAHEYDSYIYTARGTPIRPGVPVGPINPPIGVIGKPTKPTVSSTNNDAIPSVTVTGYTPNGLVDRFEFWVSTDQTNYSLMGTDLNANGEPFNYNTALSYTNFTLLGGTYYFKVRGANKDAVGPYSDATDAFTWAPVATVNSQSQISTPSTLSSLLPLLGIGALAYLAYKYLYPEALAALSNTELGKLLGIEDPAKVAATKAALDNAATNFKLVQVGDNTLIPATRDVLEFVAGNGIEITADESTNTITIAAINNVSSLNGETGALNIVAGTNVTITQDATAKTITISADSSGGGNPGGGGGSTSCANEVLPDPMDFRLNDIETANSLADIYLKDDYVVNHCVSTLLPSGSNLRYSIPNSVGGQPAVFTHQAFIIGTSHNSTPPFFNASWGGAETTNWPSPYNYGQKTYKSLLYKDGGAILWKHYVPVNWTYPTVTAFTSATYYTFCIYDSSKSLAQQSWQNWTFAEGAGNAAGSSTGFYSTSGKNFKVNNNPGVDDTPVADYGTTQFLTVPSLGAYNSTTQRFYSSWPGLKSDCVLMAIGIAVFPSGGTPPATISYSGRTIYGTQNGSNTDLTTPGTSSTIGYYTFPSSRQNINNWWELKIWQENCVIPTVS